MSGSSLSRNPYYSAIVQEHMSLAGEVMPRVKINETLSLGEGGTYLTLSPLKRTLPSLTKVLAGFSGQSTLEDIASCYESSYGNGFQFPTYLKDFFGCYSDFHTGAEDDSSEVERIFSSRMGIYLRDGKFVAGIFSQSKGKKPDELYFRLLVPSGERRGGAGSEALSAFERQNKGKVLVCDFLPNDGTRSFFENNHYTIREVSILGKPSYFEARKRVL
jgi:hypothetical protein